MKDKKFFSCSTPCGNCPYRRDSPLQHWDKKEFEQLLQHDKEQFGKVYGCHKNNGTVCRGYLMNQEKRNLPNINLRLQLAEKNVTRKYLEGLKCKSEMFDTIEEMSLANFPDIKL